MNVLVFSEHPVNQTDSIFVLNVQVHTRRLVTMRTVILCRGGEMSLDVE